MSDWNDVRAIWRQNWITFRGGCAWWLLAVVFRVFHRDDPDRVALARHLLQYTNSMLRRARPETTTYGA